MARTKKTTKKTTKKSSRIAKLIPEPAQNFIARRIQDLFAIALCAFALFLCASLLTYNMADPSWNTSVSPDMPIQNVFGSKGSHIADLMIQVFGTASYLIVITAFVWGVRAWKRLRLGPVYLRVTALITCLIFSAIALARIPSGAGTPTPYSGGSAGGQILNALAGFFDPVMGTWGHSIIAVFAGLIGLVALSFTLPITRAQWISAASFIKTSAINIVLTILRIFFQFSDWVKHHNNNAYTPPKRPALEKKPKASSNKSSDAKTIIKTDTSKTSKKPVQMPEQDEQKPEKDIAVVAPKTVPTTSGKSSSQGKLSLGDEDWEYPTVDLLEETPDTQEGQIDEQALKRNAELLQNVLEDYNVQGDIVSIHPGPVVTLYEFEPAPGTKSARIIGLSDDIARSMSAMSVRASVVPGRNVIGIEIPNKVRQTVFMRDMLETSTYTSTKAKLPLILGKDIGGTPIIADLAKMPHLLVAGTTGSGKSVAVNTMLLSLLYKLSPEKCRLIMIDPKMLELSVYNDIPHLLTEVVTEPGKAIVALKWAVKEMEDRYRAMSKLGVRNIDGYNARMKEAQKKGEVLMRTVQTGFDVETGKPIYEDQPMDMNELPYIVVIVDEFADLMLVAGKDVEASLQRLAQMARAAGIHIIMATQRPSVDVITGVVKANFPTRISFQVTSKIDSRTILGDGGAEQLLGMGDMLYMAGGGKITRVHGPFASDDDVESVVNHLKLQGEPSYLETVTVGGEDDGFDPLGGTGGSSGSDVDELYDQAVALVAREQKASTSFIQRYLQIGYNRAARIVEEMESQGVIGPANHVGKREVLVQSHEEDVA